MNPTSVTQDQFLTSLRYIITTAGGWMAGKGYISGETLTAIVTLTMMVGPWLWGMYTNWKKEQTTQEREAIAVQAGVNMTVQGAALAKDGKTIVNINDGSTPPKPVTVETAKEILKDFAPATVAKA